MLVFADRALHTKSKMMPYGGEVVWNPQSLSIQSYASEGCQDRQRLDLLPRTSVNLSMESLRSTD